MKLYWATSEDSESWHGPCESDEECIRDARSSLAQPAWAEAFGDTDAIWIATVDEKTDDDAKFWEAVVSNFLHGFDWVEETLVEDGWLDPETGWEALGPMIDRDGILANALRQVLGPRPAWRNVDTSKARRVAL